MCLQQNKAKDLKLSKTGITIVGLQLQVPLHCRPDMTFAVDWALTD